MSFINGVLSGEKSFFYGFLIFLISSLVGMGAITGIASGASGASGIGDADDLNITIERIDRTYYPEVTLDISVIDPKTGESLKDLRHDNFHLTGETEIFPFGLDKSEVPLSVCLILDKSGSMTDALPALRIAAGAFLDLLGPNDECMVIVFDRTHRILHDFSVEKEKVKSTLYSINARGATALYDTLYAGIKETLNRENKKVIVVMTDGKDQITDGSPPLSKRTAYEIVDYAKSCDIPIHCIGLGDDIDRDILREIARSTHGQYYFSPTPAELKSLYEKTARNIKTTYRLTYTSPFSGSAIRPRILKLAVDDGARKGTAIEEYQMGDAQELPAYASGQVRPTPFTGERPLHIEVRDRFGNRIDGSYQILLNGQIVGDGNIEMGSAVFKVQDEMVTRQFEPKRIAFEKKPLKTQLPVPITNKLRIFTTTVNDQHIELACEMAPVSNPLDKKVFVSTADGLGNTSWTSDIAPGRYLIWLKDGAWTPLMDEIEVPHRQRAIIRYKFARVIITINGRELKDFEKMGINLKITELNSGRIIFPENRLYHFTGADSSGILPQGRYLLELTDASPYDTLTLARPLQFQCTLLGGEEIFSDITLEDIQYHRIGP